MIGDLTLNVIDVSVIPVEEGAEHVMVGIVPALGLPTPQGAVQIPAMILRIPMSRDAAIGFADSLKAEAEKVKPQTNIAIANSLAGVENIAAQDKRMRGQQ
jgi:hypothetical protein